MLSDINYCMGCMEEKTNQDTCPNCGWFYDAEVESPLHLKPGMVLQGKYLIGRVLGQGGFGITYLAMDLNLNIKLAIKEFFPQGMVSRVLGLNEVTVATGDIGSQYEYGLERFLVEARTLARFEKHPGIVTVRDYFQGNNTAYMVMSFIDGVSLEEYLQQEGGSLSFRKTMDIMMPVIDALKEVHSVGFLHRDISPDNIFLDYEGRVFLIDFGAARQDMREKSKSLSVILKAGYAPEEQYRSRGKQGPWTDVYAVAATIYRAITGQVPPESMDRMAEDIVELPSTLGATIKEEKEKILMKAMAVMATNRYQSMGAC